MKGEREKLRAENERRAAGLDSEKSRQEQARLAEERRQAREEKAREQEKLRLARERSCVVKPVMTDEEIANCREVWR